MRYYVESKRTPRSRWVRWDTSGNYGHRTKRAALLFARSTPAHSVCVVLVIRDRVRRTYNAAGHIL